MKAGNEHAKERILLYYFGLLSFSLLAFVVAWKVFADPLLFRCVDPGVPWALDDMFPPFIHPGTGDIYSLPERLVTFIWGCCIFLVMAVPALVLWLAKRCGWDDWNPAVTPV